MPERLCKECGQPALPPGRGLYCRLCLRAHLREQGRVYRASLTPDQKAARLAKTRERDRQRYKTDPEYRKRKTEATLKRRLFYGSGDVSEAEWQALTQIYGGKCAYCFNDATEIEHIHPVALGGSHSVDNLVPACKPCNLSKRDTPLILWGGR